MTRTRSVLLVLALATLVLSGCRQPEGISVKAFPGFETNTAKSSIPLAEVVSGGPGRDGIPAIRAPKFVSVADSPERDDVRGIFLDIGGDQRFYPFSILVWHEIVDDWVGGRPVAVTFCPLCGSGIVYDRRVDGETLLFGVSGFLRKSNMLMYDDVSESLWSQSRGEAVVGDYTGAQLGLVPMQLLTMRDVRRGHPDAKVLSRDTGHARDYARNPYAGYDETDDLYFPVEVTDRRYGAKTPMWVFRVGDKSVALPFSSPNAKPATRTIEGSTVMVSRPADEVLVTVDGEPVPGYTEMWFSWAAQHEADGVVWELDKE
ncbi:MAG: hypothetical protein CVT67_01945 [Actinobacteria bacterium HGW-Actinobacteria-7]|jgi:hypothetical protein|nr:MAG: hypothetical protein CVT67_01945 [Actinobacteria bacterium HGW-Actinobacteria-7]